ncbi:MAG: 4Fe-4S dicluster domain-containing protein [Chloroflexi bacterium]|nr:4Fe-4S dicluster domain-containing protein [Chloroflexota bacterium]
MRDEDLATCVSCGLCLNDCPTYRVLGNEADSPRGRIQLIRELVRTNDAPGASVVAHLEACLVCRACETACPSGVPFGRIMEGAREVLRERVPGSRRARLLRRLGLGTVARPTRLRLATSLASFYTRTGLQRVVRATRFLPARLRGMERLLSAPEGAPFDPHELAARPAADIALLAGCVIRIAFGETERSTVRLLESDDRTVTSPRAQRCCGALHAHSGDGDGARALARENIAAFEGSSAPIVVNAAGCCAHLKAYGAVLAGDPQWSDRATAFAARVRDASEVVAATSVRAAVRPIRVVYQDACHLAHGQQIRRQPRALLQALQGVTLVPIADAERCCGSAGIYNLTHPEVATELERQKVAAILAARPDIVVSANPGCMLQLRAGLRDAGSSVPVVHLMRFLDDPAACLR